MPASPRIMTGDCRTDLREFGPFDLLIADPPYGDTSLKWDRRCEGWIEAAAKMLKSTGSIWIFGSMRFFMDHGVKFKMAGLRYAQDVIWEKHNGSSFHADRFKRVHEHITQFYLASSPWGNVFNEVQTTPDVIARSVRMKRRPSHMGNINAVPYHSEDGGPLLMRSVIYMRSTHGRAIHPTEKPDALIEILIRTSCPPGGLVGDMFAGSGAGAEAAMRAGRRYVGCEIDKDMANAANNRMAQLLPLSTA